MTALLIYGNVLMALATMASGKIDTQSAADVRVKLTAEVLDNKTPSPSVRLSLANVSDWPLWLNIRFAWNSRAQSPQNRELEIRFLDLAEDVPFRCKPRTSSVGPLDYVVLYPGKFVGTTILLKRCLTLKPGRYKIVVVYQDSNAPKELVKTFPRFDKELVSEPLELVVSEDEKAPSPSPNEPKK